MTSAKYRPRDFASNGELFGKYDEVVWREVLRSEVPKLRASQLQHRYAMRIRSRLRARGGTVKQLAAKAGGMSYDRLTKVLRGDVIMRLEDIALMDLLLGDVIEPPMGAFNGQ